MKDRRRPNKAIRTIGLVLGINLAIMLTFIALLYAGMNLGGALLTVAICTLILVLYAHRKRRPIPPTHAHQRERPEKW